MFYIPSPIPLVYDQKYQALANPSGRMQYFCETKGTNRSRIPRTDFLHAYNTSNIIAIRPLPSSHPGKIFQFEFFTLDKGGN